MKQILLASTFIVGFGVSAFAATDTNLEQVVLSSSGLGQYTFGATVDGNATLTLPVRRDQVNDVLKSLVILDSAGKIGAVTLPGDEGLSTLFRSLPFDQSAFSSLTDFITATRGQHISVSGAAKATGQIMTLTPVTSRAPDGSVVTQHMLSLLNEDGLQQVVLEQVTTLKYADEKLNAAMIRALRGFAAQTNKDQRQVAINLFGDKKREIAVSYTIEAPVWKVAYRLRLAAADQKQNAEKGFLQGWAIVENTSPEDWKNVTLTLTSGAPVTYQQALYPSYFVQRPILPLPIPNTIQPRIDNGAMREVAEMAAVAAPAPMMAKSMRAPMADMAVSESMAYGGAAGANFAGVQNMAVAQQNATQLSFTFPTKVTVASGESLMMPFLATSISGETVYLYQPDTNAEHPYASVAVKNTSDSALPPGIVTLYQSPGVDKPSQYVGDANIGTVPAGEERLIPFALDQDTQIAREVTSQPNISKIAAAKGVLTLSTVQQTRNKYLIKGAAKTARKIVIEEPKMGGWNLVKPDPKTVVETSTHYRVTKDVKAGETVTVDTILEYPEHQEIRLADLDAQTLVNYTSMGGDISPSAKAALQGLAEKRRAVDDLDQRMANAEAERQALYADQERMRKNLNAVPDGSDLSKRYLKTLDDQENRLDALVKNIESLRAQREKAWDHFTDGIGSIQF